MCVRVVVVVVCLFDFCFCLVYARFFIAASICVHFAVPPAPLLLPVVVVVVVRVLVAFVLISLFPFTSTLSLSLSLFTFCHKWRLIYQFVCLPMEFILPSVPSPFTSSSSTTFSLCHPRSLSLSPCTPCLALCLALICCLFAIIIIDVVIFIALSPSLFLPLSSILLCHHRI